MSSSIKFVINKLILVGYRKNYEIKFYPGVNIIYGEEDSGKSSILELISYLLGSKKIDKYIELEESVKYAVLELNLNNEIYCIKRDIFDAKIDIEIFTADYKNINTVFPKKYKPNYDNSSEGNFFSDFLLDSLSLPKIKIKNSPTKDNSKLARLSFRDLFKFCYLSQDDVGIKNLLGNQNYVLYPKIKEVFKYIFNLNDEEISELHRLISEKSSIRSHLDNKISNIREFLETIEIESEDWIKIFLENINTNINKLEKEIKNIDDSITNDSKKYKPLKEHLVTLNYKIKNQQNEKLKSITNIEMFNKLFNDYYDDNSKIEGILSAKKIIGEVSPAITICPLCENIIDENKFIGTYSIHDTKKLNSEKKILNRRMKDLIDLIDKETKLLKDSEEELLNLKQEQEQIKESIDNELQKHISPYLAKRDEIIKEQSILHERKQQIEKSLKIRNEENNLIKQIFKLDEDIKNFKNKLDKLKLNQPRLKNVLNDLKIILSSYLRFVGVKNLVDINIDIKTFLPMLRNKQYSEITSGGIRTILSIGFLLNILEYGLTDDINLPGFLMVDTVGKYLQKTKQKYLSETDKDEDFQEGIEGAGKYRSLYEYIIQLSIRMEEANKSCQIILVDNDVPPFIEENYKGFVIKKFSKDPNDELSIGLIDDYNEDMYIK